MTAEIDTVAFSCAGLGWAVRRRDRARERLARDGAPSLRIPPSRRKTAIKHVKRPHVGYWAQSDTCRNRSHSACRSGQRPLRSALIPDLRLVA